MPKVKTLPKVSTRRIKAASLISGGLDSAVLVAWAAAQGYDQLAFFVNYGQDNLNKELAAARINTQKAGVALEVINISGLRDSFVGRFPFPINLYDCEVKNPLGQITTFAMSVLVAGVSVLADRFTLLMGIHHTDMEKRPVLRNNMKLINKVVNNVVKAFTTQEFNLVLPFKDRQRKDVIRLGMRLGVDFVNTWSCHEAKDIACGVCEGCKERIEAFQLVNVADPQLGKGLSVPVNIKL